MYVCMYYAIPCSIALVKWMLSLLLTPQVINVCMQYVYMHVCMYVAT